MENDKEKEVHYEHSQVHMHDHSEAIEISQLMDEVAKVDNFQIVAEIFRQLSDTTRLRIFWLLCHCEECVTNIAAMLDMSSPAVSHHLKELKSCGLIESSRIGKEVYYKAKDDNKSRFLHKMIEDVVEIACPEYKNDQIESIHKVHDYLVEHLNERVTIEELSKMFLLNTTTLKTLFKETYGDSVASHMKAHRLEHAAKLLSTTEKTLSEIAQDVGYESQSKFSAAFKETYGVLPSEYRRKH